MNNRTKELLAKRDEFGASHYKGNDAVVFKSGRGIYLKDVEGNTYIDAVAGYSSVNVGHNHPRVNAVGRSLFETDKDGWGITSVVPNSFLTVAQADFLAESCTILGADKALATNGGVEAVEAAMKLMLKWGYTRRAVRIPRDHGLIIMFDGNFHGRTTAVIAGSSTPAYKKNFGPFAGNIIRIPYNDPDVLQSTLVRNRDRVAGLIIEPIQGEGGVRIPRKGYLAECYRLAKKFDIVFCADEIQTGLGRAGALLVSRDEGVDPDIFLLAKSLGAGKTPVAMVYAKKEYMCFVPGDHGSTYGGNPSGMTIAREILRIVVEENLCEKSRAHGHFLKKELTHQLSGTTCHDLVKEIRGRGLMIGIELARGVDPERMIDCLLQKGVVTKDAHGVIRITPPLVITKSECQELARRIKNAFVLYAKDVVQKEHITA